MSRWEYMDWLQKHQFNADYMKVEGPVYTFWRRKVHGDDELVMSLPTGKTHSLRQIH